MRLCLAGEQRGCNEREVVKKKWSDRRGLGGLWIFSLVYVLHLR